MRARIISRLQRAALTHIIVAIQFRSMRARIISRLQHAFVHCAFVHAVERSMRARIISRLQRWASPGLRAPGGALNEGQDYIPATTGRVGWHPVICWPRSMRARIISRLQRYRRRRDQPVVVRSMRARIISRLQRRDASSSSQRTSSLNEGQDYIPATTGELRCGVNTAGHAQ